MAATPDYSAWLNEIWGWPSGYGDWLPFLGSASNVAIGDNPPYGVNDFAQFYPQFIGVLTELNVNLTQGSNVIESTSGPFPTGPGGMVIGTGISDINGDTTIIPAGTIVTYCLDDEVTFTVSQNMPQTIYEENIVYYTSGVGGYVPYAVINAYIALASACLQQARWQEIWYLAVGWFVAHYLTLWLQSQQSNNPTIAQVANAGLAIGVKTSKAVGDVSVGIQPLYWEEWGSWTLTLYGQQLMTNAKVIGSGGMLLY